MLVTLPRAAHTAVVAILGFGLSIDASAAELVGRAMLPSQTSAKGPTAGQHISGAARGIVERDGSQRTTSGYKAIPQIRLGTPGTNMDKALLVDLQNIADPRRISLQARAGDVGLGNPFSFPSTTIEDIVVLGPRRIGVLNGNNVPFSIGRHVGSGAPDDNAFIALELDRPLRGRH